VLAIGDSLSCGPLPPITDVRGWIDARKAYWQGLVGVAEDGRETLYSEFFGASVIGDVLIDAFDELRAGIGGRDMVGDNWLFDRMVRLAGPKLREPVLELTGSRVEAATRRFASRRSGSACSMVRRTSSTSTASTTGCSVCTCSPRPGASGSIATAR
jgi:hypothetical protein